MCPDKFPEAFRRFEKSDIDISDVRDSNDLIRKFRYWINRSTSDLQDKCLRKEARRLGIPISPQRKITIYAPLPKPIIKPHITFHTVKGKIREVRRIPKGQKGAGRFVKKS